VGERRRRLLVSASLYKRRRPSISAGMATFREMVRELLSFRRSSSLDRWAASAHRFRREAELRGAQLLADHMSREQRIEYETRGYFHVTGSDTGKCYRIQRGYQMNVEELDERGRRVCSLCFMPEGCLPLGDLLLAQKMALELFEADALRVANQSPTWNAIAEERVPLVRRY
jgi:hypothetical protein